MRKFGRFLLVGVIAVLAIVGAAGLAYLYWYQPSYDFLSTTDASVTGSLVRVAAPASGQIYDLLADQGVTVKKGDVLATIQVTAVGSSVPRLLAYATSPISGTVAVRNVSAGEMIAAGQTLASVVDLQQLWVVANVDETRVDEIRIGQTADVTIGDIHQTFRGRVSDIGSATNNVISPSISLSNTSDTVQKVPVKIAFDYAGERLIPGMSAAVTIHTRETAK